MRYFGSLESVGFIGGPTLPRFWVTSEPQLDVAVAVADPLSSALVQPPTMSSLTPIDTDTLVNSNTADGQISPKVVALTDGRYMIVWVGAVAQPVVTINGTFAPSYANADIRAQMFNADGTRSGGEFIVNTTTAGAQLRVVATKLSDGNVLVSWHDGVGPAGGSAETTPNTIRAQEFTSAGVPTGTEFAIGNSNGRLHSVAATPDGGFVVTYQQGGVGGAVPIGNIVTQVYNSSNLQTSSFVVDSTQPLAISTLTTVESDGDVVVFWYDRDVNNVPAWHSVVFDQVGGQHASTFLPTTFNVDGLTTLATGGHAYIVSNTLENGQATSIYAVMNSADGSLSTQVDIAQTTVLGGSTITALANGGFLASWIIDTDPTNALNADIMAQAYNAAGNPVGSAFQLNSVSPGNQSPPSITEFSNGDFVATWSDDSHLTGDTSGTGINMRRIDYDPANHAPTASNFTISLGEVAPGTPVTIDPDDYDGFIGPDGYDADGDPLTIAGIANVANGTATLNPDGTLTLNATPGANAPLTFDFTISDGQGGSATARTTVVMPTDYVTVRVGSTALIDFLANDYYTPTAGATGFTVTSAGPLMGGSAAGFTQLVNTPAGQRIVFDPLAPTFGPVGSIDITSSFFSLAVGQTAQYRFFYYNNQIFNSVIATIQGWAQLGGTGADSLVGTALADHLSGGTGAANTLTGGLGNDWYTVAVAGDTIVELAGEGIDSVRTALATYTLPDNVENLRFLYNSSSYLQRGIGNALDNLITVGTSNTSELYGLDGNDTLIGNGLFVGGAGADAMTGGFSTIDTASYADSPAAVSLNLLTNVNTGGDAQGDTLYMIERIVGSAFADTIVGSANADILNGGNGNDFLSGGDGYDTLNGEDGDDILAGGAGPDIIDGGAGTDEVRYSGNLANYTIQRVDNYGYGLPYIRIAGMGSFLNSDNIDTVRNVEYAQFADQRISLVNHYPMVGPTPIPDQTAAEGALYSYQFPAGAFSDPDVFDVLAYSVTISGVSTYWLSFDESTRTLRGTPLLSQVGSTYQVTVKVYDIGTGDPNSFVTDTFNVTVIYATGPDIFGTPGNDTNLVGTNASERIYGRQGDDTITGGIGNDSLYGEGGNDTLNGETSDAVLDGGDGVDTLVFSASGTLAATITGFEALMLDGSAGVTMTSAQFRSGFAETSALTGVGTLIIDMATGLDELYLQRLTAVVGSYVSITVNGSSSDDTVKGILTLRNRLYGGDGADFLRGGAVSDLIEGGNGDDKIEGAGAPDTLTGGAGADVFRYQSASASGLGVAADWITDFVIGTDKLGFALIDANAATPEDDAFDFIGTAAFANTGVGQIRYQNSTSALLVQVDIDGNGTADMEIVLQGLGGGSLTGGDFLL